MKITHEDAELLKKITDAFGKNVSDNFDGDAQAAFTEKATGLEIAKLITTKIRANFNANALSAEKRARTMLSHNSAALPILKRTFGEAALIDALPEEAKDQRVVDLCEELGARNIASLCRKAMDTKARQAKRKFTP